MEAISRRLCKNIEDPNNQPIKFVELFLFWMMAMKTHEDRIVGMYIPGCTQYRNPMLDVLMWTLVWIGVAAIHLDYPKVDVAV